jgi:hypothetical protein
MPTGEEPEVNDRRDDQPQSAGGWYGSGTSTSSVEFEIEVAGRSR